VSQLLEIKLTFNRLLRECIADSLVDISKFGILFLTRTVKDRYRFILEDNPSFLNRFPLRFIASMIGVKPTQLSRIWANKKNVDFKGISTVKNFYETSRGTFIPCSAAVFMYNRR